MRTTVRQAWDLDTLFSGGSGSDDFECFLAQLEQDLAAMQEIVPAERNDGSIDSVALIDMICRMQDIGLRMEQASAFVACLEAQNTGDEGAHVLASRIGRLQALLAHLQSSLDALFIQVSDAAWDELVQTDLLKEVQFPLSERRARSECRARSERRARRRDRMEHTIDSLVSDLSVDGYHAWGRLYHAVVGRMSLHANVDGSLVKMSIGQAENKLVDANRSVREEVFEKWEETWEQESDLLSSVINHLAGFKLAVCKHRRVESPLVEVLERNRMKRETLDAMWDVVDQNKGIFVHYLIRKARLIGVDKLSWHDVLAPIYPDGGSISYSESVQRIPEYFSTFSSDLAEFTRKCFREGWVEVEDRPNKAPGAFCVPFPGSKQSRIFMTYSEQWNSFRTLAHELGHAYHNHCMSSLPHLAQSYSDILGETASIFSEFVATDAVVQSSSDNTEKIALLGNKIDQFTSYYMNIQARYLFENRFYQRRKDGVVSVSELNHLMEESQHWAFGNSLQQYHPLFWASKMHFYFTTDGPFYNFPYTFGCLFSSGLYARALKDGRSFSQTYIELLRDTGRLPVEELALKHLGVDLATTEFWQSAMDVAVCDIQQFLRLTDDV